MRGFAWLLVGLVLLGAGEALLYPIKEYRGFLEVGKQAPGLLVLRDQAAYDAFLDQIPTERIQMKQPAPPSTDPLLERPPVDFKTTMAIVAFSHFWHDEVDIELMLLESDGESVKVKVKRSTPPGAEHGAAPDGIGQYHLVLLERRSGTIQER